VKTIEEIIEALGEEDGAVVTDAINAEKQRGIDASRKKGDDVKKFMTLANKLRDSLRSFDIDPDGDIDAQIAAVKDKATASRSQADAGNEQINSLKKEMAKILQKLEAAEVEKTAAHRKYQTSKISESLSKAFGDSIYGVDLAIEGLISKGAVKMSDDDKVIFVNGDEELDIEAGVEAYKKARPDLVKNSQRPGPGSAPQKNKNSKTITAQQYDAMTVKQRAEFFAAGGEMA
jgi:hypothetical protein